MASKLKAAPTAPDIAARLSLHGVAVLPEYYPGGVVNRIRSELQHLCQAYAGEIVIERDYLVTKRIRQEWIFRDNATHCFALQNYVANPLWEDVCKAYFTEPYRLPTKHYATFSRGGSDMNALPYRLHFDDMRFLKFFVYLTDVDETSGPILVMPGTHRLNSRYHQRQIDAGRTFDQIDVKPCAYGPVVTLTGGPGTVVIFTTDTSHCAGCLGAGRTREAFQILVATERDLRWRNYPDPHP